MTALDHHFTATNSSFKPLNFGKWARQRGEGEGCTACTVLQRAGECALSINSRIKYRGGRHSLHSPPTRCRLTLSLSPSGRSVSQFMVCSIAAEEFSFQFVSAHSIKLCPTAMQCNECEVYLNSQQSGALHAVILCIMTC